MCACEPRPRRPIGSRAADFTQGQYLKSTAVIALSALLGSAAVMAAGDSDTGSNPIAFVKDSAITTKVRSKMAADHLSSMGTIKVDTDRNGVVWTSSTAGTQAAVDPA